METYSPAALRAVKPLVKPHLKVTADKPHGRDSGITGPALGILLSPAMKHTAFRFSGTLSDLFLTHPCLAGAMQRRIVSQSLRGGGVPTTSSSPCLPCTTRLIHHELKIH